MDGFRNCAGGCTVGLICLTLVCAFGVHSAHASEDPGQVQRRIQDTDREDLVDQPSDPRLPGVAPYRQPDTERFTLTGVTVSGSTVFSGEELAPLYERFMATEVGRSDLMDIADAATKFYQDRGYTLSRAFVPPQSIIAGVIELRIIEGYVKEVQVRGDTGGVDFAPYTQNILAERPLSQSTFERNLLLMHDLGGLKITDIALAEEVDGSGAYTLGLTSTYDAWEGSLYADNRGTDAVGPVQLGLSASANSLLGLGEILTASAYTTPTDPNELQYGQLRLHQPIGSDGFALSLSGAYSATDPSGPLSSIGREGASVFGSIEGQYPLIRMRNETLWLRGSFDIRNVTDETEFGIIFDDRLRVARLKVEYVRTDEWNGSNFVSVGIDQGLDILGASGAGHRFASRADGEVQFTKLVAEYYRWQRLWGDELALAVRVAGQKSSAPLLSSEEMGLGGARFGRAYEYSELTGDDGVAGSVELQYTPGLRTPIADNITFYGFFDIGAVWNRNAAPGFERQSLASAGSGIRFRVLEQLSATAELAKPLTRDSSRGTDRDPQFYFSLYNPL
ncbi:MAG: ShlB/FhaC/HecB family hemolysin secretion/activation protein [Parvibaculaceae bacterium]|nr:ShlB/FhaC/HecB family hemolysin secretion/activation protein [Parvibaculaceae bacterium]HBM88371.1 ShlB/FhaC/HecB family hemolysin secretion/activation protein [Rhodobiaceae bacterium]|tara:strand:- start:276 stop:1964 length:1689 start_codon:yes stop_codon:yes gene_type:complete